MDTSKIDLQETSKQAAPSFRERLRTLLFGTNSTHKLVEHYFQMLANEFECLKKPDSNDAHALELWIKATKLKEQLKLRLVRQREWSGWDVFRLIGLISEHSVPLSEVYGLELLMLYLLTPEQLITKAWNIEATFKKVASTDDCRQYDVNKLPELKVPPDNKAGDAKYILALRENAADLLRGTHWWYSNSYYREVRIGLLKRRLVFGMSACLALVLAISNCSAQSPLFVLLMVVLMGVMGSIFSIGSRISSVSKQDVADSNPIIKASQFDHGGAGIVLSIIVGGMSALILYVLMAAHLSPMNDKLTPKFLECNAAVISGVCCDSYRYFVGLLPDSTESFLQALCWSFLAGFAERLVPDILDRMAKNDKGEAK